MMARGSFARYLPRCAACLAAVAVCFMPCSSGRPVEDGELLVMLKVPLSPSDPHLKTPVSIHAGEDAASVLEPLYAASGTSEDTQKQVNDIFEFKLNLKRYQLQQALLACSPEDTPLAFTTGGHSAGGGARRWVRRHGAFPVLSNAFAGRSGVTLTSLKHIGCDVLNMAKLNASDSTIGIAINPDLGAHLISTATFEGGAPIPWVGHPEWDLYSWRPQDVSVSLSPESPVHSMRPALAREKGKYFSCVLMAGLGNQLFQIAASLHACAHWDSDEGCAPVFHIWTDPKVKSLPPGVANQRDLAEWGGHAMKQPVAISDVFPQLPWVDRVDRERVDLSNASWQIRYDAWMTDITGSYVPLRNCGQLPCRVIGYFFSHRYWFGSLDRIRTSLRFGWFVHQAILSRYPSIISNSKTSTSVHIRLGNSNDPFKVKVGTVDYFEAAMNHVVDHTSVFYIFSDNLELVRSAFLPRLQAVADTRAAQVIIVDEDVPISLALMSACYNHILSASTLSFWGMALSNHVLEGQTVYGKFFFKTLPREMFPAEWITTETFTELPY